MTTPFRLRSSVGLALLLCAVTACGSSHRTVDTTASQLRFGVNMAEKGLWSEALFRFEQAQRMGGGGDPQVLNNLAVASEALGRFDEALGFYKQALALEPGNQALKNNYERFVSFYESYRARGTAPAGPTPAVDAGRRAVADHSRRRAAATGDRAGGPQPAAAGHRAARAQRRADPAAASHGSPAMRHRRPLLLVLLVGVVLAAGAAYANTVEVKLKLPVRAALDLTGRKKLVVAPFVITQQEGDKPAQFRGRNLDVKGDFNKYLLKVLKRDSGLEVTPVTDVEYPTDDLDKLAHDRDFWRALGERTQGDLLLTGSLDFDVQDKSGYKLEEYTSPYDGRTYYRQVLVEETGFEFDILMQVYDGATGDLLYQDNFKDFKTLEGAGADPVQGMFQNLFALEDRIVGIFAQKDVEATRALFKP